MDRNGSRGWPAKCATVNEEALAPLNIRFNCFVINEMGRVDAEERAWIDAGEWVSFSDVCQVYIKIVKGPVNRSTNWSGVGVTAIDRRLTAVW